MIYLDLHKSKYKYNYKNFCFVFSSSVSLNNFKKRINKEIEERTRRLNIYYNATGSYDELIVLNLYKRIEKRDFLVYYNKKELKDYSFKVGVVINDKV